MLVLSLPPITTETGPKGRLGSKGKATLDAARAHIENRGEAAMLRDWGTAVAGREAPPREMSVRGWAFHGSRGSMLRENLEATE
jgi:hypothetical protein